MMQINEILRRFTETIPREYRVNVYASKHFVERCKLRNTSNLFDLYLGVAWCVNQNYPLILYYSKLKTALPERGRLEHSKYIICGDVYNESFVLRTIYEKCSLSKKL
jgi:hypothetical protein